MDNFNSQTNKALKSKKKRWKPKGRQVEQIVLDEEIFTLEKIIYYEKKFKKDVINSSLNNIFNEKKINNFLEKFI